MAVPDKNQHSNGGHVDIKPTRPSLTLPDTVPSRDFHELNPREQVDYLVRELVTFNERLPILEIPHEHWLSPQVKNLPVAKDQDVSGLHGHLDNVEHRPYEVTHNVNKIKNGEYFSSGHCTAIAIATACSQAGHPASALPTTYALPIDIDRYFVAGVRDKYQDQSTLDLVLHDNFHKNLNPQGLVDQMLSKPDGTIGFIAVANDKGSHIFNMSVKAGVVTVEDHGLVPPKIIKLTQENKAEVVLQITKEMSGTQIPFGLSERFFLMTPFGETGLHPTDITNGQMQLVLDEQRVERMRQLSYKISKEKYAEDLAQLNKILDQYPEFTERVILNGKELVAGFLNTVPAVALHELDPKDQVRKLTQDLVKYHSEVSASSGYKTPDGEKSPAESMRQLELKIKKAQYEENLKQLNEIFDKHPELVTQVTAKDKVLLGIKPGADEIQADFHGSLHYAQKGGVADARLLAGVSGVGFGVLAANAAKVAFIHAMPPGVEYGLQNEAADDVLRRAEADLHGKSISQQQYNIIKAGTEQALITATGASIVPADPGIASDVAVHLADKSMVEKLLNTGMSLQQAEQYEMGSVVGVVEKGVQALGDYALNKKQIELEMQQQGKTALSTALNLSKPDMQWLAAKSETLGDTMLKEEVSRSDKFKDLAHLPEKEISKLANLANAGIDPYVAVTDKGISTVQNAPKLTENKPALAFQQAATYILNSGDSEFRAPKAAIKEVQATVAAFANAYKELAKDGALSKNDYMALEVAAQKLFVGINSNNVKEIVMHWEAQQQYQSMPTSAANRMRGPEMV